MPWGGYTTARLAAHEAPGSSGTAHELINYKIRSIRYRIGQFGSWCDSCVRHECRVGGESGGQQVARGQEAGEGGSLIFSWRIAGFLKRARSLGIFCVAALVVSPHVAACARMAYGMSHGRFWVLGHASSLLWKPVGSLSLSSLIVAGFSGPELPDSGSHPSLQSCLPPPDKHHPARADSSLLSALPSLLPSAFLPPVQPGIYP